MKHAMSRQWRVEEANDFPQYFTLHKQPSIIGITINVVLLLLLAVTVVAVVAADKTLLRYKSHLPSQRRDDDNTNRQQAAATIRHHVNGSVSLRQRKNVIVIGKQSEAEENTSSSRRCNDNIKNSSIFFPTSTISSFALSRLALAAPIRMDRFRERSQKKFFSTREHEESSNTSNIKTLCSKLI
jgi:hypothetical protein